MTKISPCLALLCFQMHGLRAPSLLPWKEHNFSTELRTLLLSGNVRLGGPPNTFIIIAHLDISPLTFIEVSSLCRRKTCPHHESILHFNTSVQKHVPRSNCVSPSNIPLALPTLNTAKFHLVPRRTLYSRRSSKSSEGSHGRTC